ncbi:penicillin-binding protein 2 [Sinanaerobacter sp. ZZT-01]|uniref:peptidoglycan D,D-transpeptidase FtsI family protein n=1 Tax=Sinanaerobacter sp. ZZT-01 TaxID=3111540 RepID=UPI002D77441B|nr:penicillin-binding protein 2 [Sinanaerobacter sp. ZZT-01]WRR92608.1 penicillin-binding protein 2 [Sinanaerobacter sp. ZZT-01]
MKKGSNQKNTSIKKKKENKREDKQKQRLMICIVFFFLCLFGLAVKLTWIQLIDQGQYVSVINRQHRIMIEGVDKRGVIYDRNQNPITDAVEEYVYIIRKESVTAESKKLLNRMNAKAIRSDNFRYYVYRCDTFYKEESKKLEKEYGAFIMKTKQRYSDEQPAVHLIGYLNGADGNGVCGLEKDYDDYLSQQEKSIYSVGDGSGYIIPGQGIHGTTGKEVGLLTTIDLPVQKKAESVLRKSGLDGTIIITDVRNGAVLAAASSPTFDPNKVEEYLRSKGKELMNHATQGQYPPGSVFKMVVAAAALENGISPDTVFTCIGHEDLGGISIKCASGGETGHGEISFEDAFAKSCNATFIQIGKQLGGQTILDMARLFGFNEKTLTGYSSEKAGNLPSLQDAQGAGIGNLSIGQGTLLVTPMQVAKMTQIIANDGACTGLQLVRGIVTNGKQELFPKTEIQQCISRETAEILQRFMIDTAKYGTANNLGDLSAGGKTGSAEAADNGERVVHGWFTGFIPAQHPLYTITVFVEQGGSGRASAVPIFKEIAENLLLSTSKDGSEETR